MSQDQQLIELKTCYDTTMFLRPDQYASLLLIIWRRSNYKQEHVPKLWYRVGYYEEEEDGHPYFVGSSDLVFASTYYFFPDILEDYPVLFITLDNKKENWKWSFIEVNDTGTHSVHYILSRVDKYFNPFKPSEDVYTEIFVDSPSDQGILKENFDDAGEQTNGSLQGTDFSDFNSIEFEKFIESVSCHSNLGNKKETIMIKKDQVISDENEPHVPDTPKVHKCYENDEFGFLWLDENHWKRTFRQTGYSIFTTAFPPSVVGFIDLIIKSMGNHMRTQMLSSLHRCNIPEHLEKLIEQDYPKWCYPLFSVDDELAYYFCYWDICNALSSDSRRKAIELKKTYADYGERFVIFSHEDMLNEHRAKLDPFNPFMDKCVASLFSLYSCGSRYFSDLQMMVPNMVDSMLLRQCKRKDEKNIVKLRIFAGDVISLTRNGVTYGINKHIRPRRTMKQMNERIETITNISEQESEKISDESPILDAIIRQEDYVTKTIIGGCDEVETIVYLIDNEVVVISPFFPVNICLYGTWCHGDVKEDKFLYDKISLLPEILSTFYKYNCYVPRQTENDIVKKCFELYLSPTNP